MAYIVSVQIYHSLYQLSEVEAGCILRQRRVTYIFKQISSVCVFHCDIRTLDSLTFKNRVSQRTFVLLLTGRVFGKDGFFLMCLESLLGYWDEISCFMYFDYIGMAKLGEELDFVLEMSPHTVKLH
jgi:hypothetical protein